LPVRVLSRLFRRLFLEKLKAAFEAGRLAFFGAAAELAAAPVFARRLSELRRTEWIIYAKRPFAGPAAALTYLGRYTHRVAISNSRLIDMTGDRVRFRWRDYRHHNKSKVMALAADEFIRRFLLHTLPDGFHRIRHYGFLGNRHRTEKIVLCQELLAGGAAAAPDTDEPGQTRDRTCDLCPSCGGPWRCSARFRDRAQPIPRHGTTAHECRGLVLMGNALAIFGRRHRRSAGVTRHAAPAAPPSLRAAWGIDAAFANDAPARNGAPARRSPWDGAVPGRPPSNPHATDARCLFPIA
jgi:hypothetical protein